METWRGYRRAGPAARIGASEGHQSCCVLSESFARKDDRSTVTWIALEIMSINVLQIYLQDFEHDVCYNSNRVIQGYIWNDPGKCW